MQVLSMACRLDIGPVGIPDPVDPRPLSRSASEHGFVGKSFPDGCIAV